MPRFFPFDQAAGALHELVEGLVPGEELVLTDKGKPKVIVTKPSGSSWPCEPGSAKNTNIGWPRILMSHWMILRIICNEHFICFGFAKVLHPSFPL